MASRCAKERGQHHRKMAFWILRRLGPCILTPSSKSLNHGNFRVLKGFFNKLSYSIMLQSSSRQSTL
jgi:hypothetical protein